MSLFLSTEVHERKRRSFRSYYYNYYDEMAMSICASVPGAARHVFPVRRACTSASKTTCAMVCKDPNLRKQRKSLDVIEVLKEPLSTNKAAPVFYGAFLV